MNQQLTTDQSWLTLTGWWFGTWILWLSIYWESSSNWRTHIFRGVAQPPIRRCLWPDLLGKIDILGKWYWSTHCINLSHFWPTAATFLKSVTSRRRATRTGFRTMRSGSTSRTGNYAPTLWTILLVLNAGNGWDWGLLGLLFPWRIHGAAIYGVPWIPSIYPLYVSIYTSTMDDMGLIIS